MSPDLAIVGGGLAGAALAIRTARAGRRVLLIEREAGPHDKVCGEFLSREAVLHLHALGVDPLGLGGVPITRVGLARGRLSSNTALPFAAVGLSRRVLDEALLDIARDAGVAVRRGIAIREIVADGAAHRLRPDRGEPILTPQVVLATGKHELRSHPRPPGRQNDLVGFKQHFRLTPPQRRRLDGSSELTLFPGGYAGLQMVSESEAALCLLVRRSRLASIGGWDGLLPAILAGAPLLADRLSDAEPVQARPLGIARIPYGLISTVHDDVWRLGDQAAVIPSFTGDGMSIALHSAARCANLLEAGEAPVSLARALHRDLGRQIGLATRLSRVAVRPGVQHAVVVAARLLPGLGDRIAARTRIAEPALERGLGRPATDVLASA